MPCLVLHREPAAPAKPEPGAPCNGCGVCCLLEPCPLGIVLSGSRRGACAALRWDSVAAVYRCGALTEPQAVAPARLPAALVPVSTWTLQHLAPRWIAAGKGCDCQVQARLPAQCGDNEGSS